MILGFKQYFPWHTDKRPAPTYFREKIIFPFLHEDYPVIWSPKLHTIRRDSSNRWKPRRKIEMVYRGPNYSIKNKFNEGIKELNTCISVQKIEMKLNDSLLVDVFIDGRELSLIEVEKLAINDGFDDLNDFYNWFTSDFSGKIIHWTDLRY